MSIESVRVTRGEGYAEVELPEGVTATLEGGRLRIKGPLGSCERDLSKIPVEVSVVGGRLRIVSLLRKRRGRAILGTVSSHVRNMIIGVTRGYVYRLKIVYSHFPVTVKVKGNEVEIENFIGEKTPRRAKIIGEGTKVSVEGDDVVVSGPCLDSVSQTAANIEQSTRIKEKDPRVFMDGVYIYERKLPARSRGRRAPEGLQGQEAILRQAGELEIPEGEAQLAPPPRHTLEDEGERQRAHAAGEGRLQVARRPQGPSSLRLRGRAGSQCGRARGPGSAQARGEDRLSRGREEEGGDNKEGPRPGAQDIERLR
jgi:large subunit ribosomal protein L6